MDGHTETQPTGQPGLRRKIAFALAALDTETVRRSTLRTLMPKGETKQRGPAGIERWHLGDRTSRGRNKTSLLFAHALQEFEQQGWVKRTPEAVIIRDRQALLRFAQEQQPTVTPDLLNIKGTLAAIRNDLRKTRDTADPQQLEQQRDEIRALLYLLHAAEPGAAHTSTLATI